MKVLAIVGSYRKGGNTDIIMDKVLAGAQDRGAATEKIFVDDINIASCRGCMEDCKKEGVCSIKDDDLAAVIQKMDQCDAFVVGTPIYGNYMTGQLKILVDRLMYTINETKIIDGKRNRLSRLQKKKRNVLTVITAGAPYKECADDALKLTRLIFGTLANGGFTKELIAININAAGQVAWAEDELAKTARMMGSPDPVESARQMKAANDAVLEEAYRIGQDMV